MLEMRLIGIKIRRLLPCHIVPFLENKLRAWRPMHPQRTAIVIRSCLDSRRFRMEAFQVENDLKNSRAQSCVT